MQKLFNKGGAHSKKDFIMLDEWHAKALRTLKVLSDHLLTNNYASEQISPAILFPMPKIYVRAILIFLFVGIFTPEILAINLAYM